MFHRFFFVLVALAFLGMSHVSFAQEEAVQEEDPARVLNKELSASVSGVMKTLDQKEVFHFMVVYANYTVLSTVKAVQKDVSGAIQACGENNPSMKDDLDSRFETWKENVGTPFAEAEANINNMALAQNYISQADLQGLFAKVDKMRSYNSSNFEKTPVTSPEACEFMLSKMDETEGSMQQLLQMTMQSYPNILEQTQE